MNTCSRCIIGQRGRGPLCYFCSMVIERMIIRMAQAGELLDGEIAEMVGLSECAVSKRISRARRNGVKIESRFGSRK